MSQNDIAITALAAIQRAVDTITGLINAALVALSFVVGKTLPTRSNTGLTSPREKLRVVTAEEVHSTAGATYLDTWFQGGVVTDARGITYVNCSFACADGTKRGGAVTVTSRGGATFTRCEHAPHSVADRGLNLNGITTVLGATVVTNQCYFEGCNDAIYGSGDWSTNGNLIDSFRFSTNDTTHAKDARHPGWVHPDGYQLRGGNLRSRGDRIIGRYHPTLGTGAAAAGVLADGRPNQHNIHCILINPTGDVPCTYDVQDMWLEQGENLFLVTGTSTRTDNNGAFKNNRLGLTCLSFGGHRNQVAVQRKLGKFDQSGNVYWEDAEAMPDAALRGKPVPWGYDGSSDYSRTN